MIKASNIATADAEIASKDFIILVPIFGSAIAIIFDVGFFAGVGGYFSLFSLSEHIGFAVQQLPGAIIFSAILWAYYLFIGLQLRTRVSRRRRSPYMFKVWPRTSLAILSMCILGLTAFTFYAIYLTQLFLLGFSVFVLLPSFLLALYFLPGIVNRAVCFVVFVTVFTFSIGYETAKIYLRPSPFIRSIAKDYGNTIIKIKDRGEIEAKPIRSGDRGMLFFDVAKKQITLVQWDRIIEVNAPP